MSSGPLFASGHGIPFNILTGRRLTYCIISLRSGINNELTLAQHALTSSDAGPWEEGFRHSLHFQNGDQSAGGAGASDYTIVRFKVEARDLANSGWDYESTSSYITLSYWIKSSVAQNFAGFLRSHDGTQTVSYTHLTLPTKRIV